MATNMITTAAGPAYLALPPAGSGPGVLVLHAWWGLTPVFRDLCERLAAAGFVALAPDLYGGRTAATIDEAEALIGTADVPAMRAAALGGLDALRGHQATRAGGLGAVGFSMGAAWALLLSTLRPDDLAAVVLFYGNGDGDFQLARAAYQGHFAPGDPWEPDEGIAQLEQTLRATGHEATFYHYPGTQHWFFEHDRPEYDADAARQAWGRSLVFLRQQLGGDGPMPAGASI